MAYLIRLLASPSEALGEDPSSVSSGTGDGGCGGATYNTLNFTSSTLFPDSLVNYKKEKKNQIKKTYSV